MPILVNQELVEDQAIRDEASLLRERLKRETPNADPLALGVRVKEWARESVIMRVLLRQATPDGTQDDALRQLTKNFPRPAATEVKAHYKAFPQRFQKPETLRVAHIVKNVDESATEEEARAAILELEQQLNAGAEFSKLADLHSDCPGDGGCLPAFTVGEMVREFEEAVSALETGKRSPVFRTPFGFHIAKLIERRPPRLPSFKEIREEVEHELWNEKKMQAADEFMRRLRASAIIEKA